MNAQDFRNLHRLWKTLVHWQLLAATHTGVLTSSRSISEREIVRAVELLLRSESDFTGRLFTWQAETGVWHEDEF
jgi:hypothetical protein